MRGVVIAGTHSGCGKTTVTLGVLSALKRMGLKVQSFKAGPDFIDSGLHSLITGMPSMNLDIWMCGREYVLECFRRYSARTDISVIEGVMGMYDGAYSTSTLAETIGLPVILVVDAYGMAESAGAVVGGFVFYDKEKQGYRDMKRGISIDISTVQRSTDSPLRIAGVIFNRVASERHYKRLKDSVRDVVVLGYLPREVNFEIPHRHLGLLVAEEAPLSDDKMQGLTDAVLRHIDIDFLIRISENSIAHEKTDSLSTPSPLKTGIKIAYAHDRAFCFYYEDNIELLREAGADVESFSLLDDTYIPAGVDAVYIGGGYPELYADALSSNRYMIEAVRNWVLDGRPLYAECGGFMYLTEGIYDLGGNFFRMTGVLPFRTRMGRKRPYLGYREIRLREDSLLGLKGTILRGHEFHYSEIAVDDSNKEVIESEGPEIRDLRPEVHRSYTVMDSTKRFIKEEGFRHRNTLASYIHIHFGSNPGTGKRFINYLRGERDGKDRPDRTRKS